MPLPKFSPRTPEPWRWVCYGEHRFSNCWLCVVRIYRCDFTLVVYWRERRLVQKHRGAASPLSKRSKGLWYPGPYCCSLLTTHQPHHSHMHLDRGRVGFWECYVQLVVNFNFNVSLNQLSCWNNRNICNCFSLFEDFKYLWSYAFIYKHWLSHANQNIAWANNNWDS